MKKIIFVLPFFLLALLSCTSGDNAKSHRGDNFVTVGSYAAHYDAASGDVFYQAVSPHEMDDQSFLAAPNFALSPADTAGLTVNVGGLFGAIFDHSKSPGQIDYALGLIDPDNCSTNYNDITGVLSFYFRLRNRSDLPDNYDPVLNPTGYEYRSASFPPLTTFFAPFVFLITGIVAQDGDPGLVTQVNTNLNTADCGADGLELSDPNDDSNSDGRFDCIHNEKPYDENFEGYPGFDFSPHIPSNRMDPGDDTGCVVFAQFTVTENESFTLNFDVAAVIDDGTLPSTPTITSHSDGDSVNTSSITVSGASCDPPSPGPVGEVYVEGGVSTVSTTCTAGGTYSLSVDMNLNETNNLNVYQIVNGKQSGAVSVSIEHDNVAPTVTSFSPANGETSVDRNTNCVITFNEAMDTSTFTASNLKITRVDTGNDEAITITNSADDTQAVLTPDNKPLAANKQFDCKALTGVTDVAGNALASANTARFTTAGTGQFFQDKTSPKVLSMLPADNQPDADPATSFIVYFDEAIDTDTVVGSVIDPVCDIDSEDIPNIFVFELSSCNGGNGQPIDGTTALSADGKIATFTPDNPSDMETNNCYGFVVTSCVKDLNGNALPSRGERNIGAYNGGTVTYNSYSVFFTGSGDSTNPSMVSVGPVTNNTSAHEHVISHMVFSEPISASTIIPDNFYITEFLESEHEPLSLKTDPTLQVISFDPTEAYALSTEHVKTVTGAVADFAGNLMDAPQTSNFTVVGTADSTAPTVVSVSPDDNEDFDGKCPFIDIHFSEPMKESTLNGSNIQLIRVRNDNVKPTSKIISDDGQHVRLIPESSLNTGNGNRNDWKISISANVEDRAGNALGSDDDRIFEVFTESVAPQVTAIVPAAGGTVNRNASVLVLFDSIMDKSTLTATNLTITGCTPIVFADPNGRWAVANCINQMTTGSKTLTVNRDVRDFYHPNNNKGCEIDAGNRMTADVTSNFTVASGDDTTAPTVSNLSDVSPQDGSTSVATSVTPSITFSEAIDPRTLFDSSVFLMKETGHRVDASLSISNDARTVTINPVSALDSPGIYYIVVTTAIRDLGGGNAYDGAGGESSEVSGVLRTCFSTSATGCP